MFRTMMLMMTSPTMTPPVVPTPPRPEPPGADRPGRLPKGEPKAADAVATEHEKWRLHPVCAAFPAPTEDQVERAIARQAGSPRRVVAWVEAGMFVASRVSVAMAKRLQVDLDPILWSPPEESRSHLREIVRLNLHVQPLAPGQAAATAVLLQPHFDAEIAARMHHHDAASFAEESNSASRSVECTPNVRTVDGRDAQSAPDPGGTCDHHARAAPALEEPRGARAMPALDARQESAVVAGLLGEFAAEGLADVRAVIARARSPVVAAARAFGISEQSVADARYVQAHAPDLFEAVHRGDLRLRIAKQQTEARLRCGTEMRFGHARDG